MILSSEDIQPQPKHPNRKFMELCFDFARKAAKQGEYAVASAVIVGNEVISLCNTSLHSSVDPTGHAELLAIRKAANKIKCKYILDGYLYTTLEPCPMCTSAAIWVKMKGIVFSANQEDAKKQFEISHGKSHDWRQIAIRSKYIIERGIPKLEIYENYLREVGLEILRLNL